MTPAERLRKNQRSLDKAIRELDQVRTKLEKQEKTLVSQIRQSAQKNQMGAAKIQAKDLVRTRRCRRPRLVDSHARRRDVLTLAILQVHREVLRDAEPVAEDISAPTGAPTETLSLASGSILD
jgi:hypothetical protein